MAKYTVRLFDEAVDDLRRLDPVISRRIFKRLDWLRLNLDSITPESLHGQFAGLYKLRIGDYRVIYEIARPECAIVVRNVGHRKNVYRQ